MQAEETPDEVAAIVVSPGGAEREITWGHLDEAARRFAGLLAARSVMQGSSVVVALPRSPEHLIATFGAWKLGACVVPLRHDLPAIERASLLELAAPAAVVADWPEVADVITPGDVGRNDYPTVAADSDIMPRPALGIASGGSTGRPKLIMSATFPGGAPLGARADPFAAVLGMRPGQTVLTGSPPYHGLGFALTYLTLFEGTHPILIERFEPSLVADLIEKHRVNFLVLVPTMMQRLLQVPGIDKRDFSSLEKLVHTASICPAWVKRRWIELLGAEKIIDVYSSTEGVGATLVRGDEWLARPGTIGKGLMTDVRILDQAGHDVPPGQVGEVYMRMKGRTDAPYQYKGADRGPVTSDGFASVGDLGWLDEDGYLFLADRRADLIISGGANIYPAEVEAAISEYPDVADVVVVGQPDEKWGKRVHAIIELAPGASGVSSDDLDSWCRHRLAAYKVPKTFEFIEHLPRTEAGKVNRSALVAPAPAD
jgi:bile acid-coenzyme A ligase